MDLTVEERAVLKRVLDHPREKVDALIAAFTDLFGQLKAEWEARPENQGKTVSYSELWQEFAGPDDGPADGNHQKAEGP